MAAAAGMADATPIDALVPLRSREQDVPGVRRGERRPEPRQSVRVLVRLEMAGGDVRRDCLGLATHLPGVAAHVAELSTGTEAELVAVSLDDGVDRARIVQADPRAANRRAVLGGQPGDQVDTGELAEAEA